MSVILKKITVKAVYGEIEAPEKGHSKPLITVYGNARRATTESTTFGDYVKFLGMFESVNMDSGEVFQSGALIVPGIVENLIFGALGSDENISGVQFAFEIGVKSDKTPTGYSYTVKSLVQPAKDDVLADLRGKLALPSPKEKVAQISGGKKQ